MNMIANTIRRSLYTFFGGGYFNSDTKHQCDADYGYPDQLVFADFHRAYKRNGIARAGITKPINKTWQDNPWILEREDAHEETQAEADLAAAFERLQFWAKLKEADQRGRIGKYAGIIFRFADGKYFREPADRVPGGLDGLVEIIPVYEGQLTVGDWDTNELSETYGQPRMYQFNEAAVDPDEQKTRSFDVHPSRVHIWSEDGTVHGESALEAGFNDLLTIKKIIGAGGEGFWKNAKSAPVLNMDKDANLQALAASLGTTVDGIADAMDETIADWQAGFDKMLFFQGIEAKALGVTLPQPQEFMLAALQSFAASVEIPLKILVGSQSGERASTEDADEWARTIMSRRNGLVIPNIKRIIARLVEVGVMLPKPWVVDWSDLTEASMDSKIARAEKMSTINKNLMGTGEQGYTSDEIRAVTGHEPLANNDGVADA